MTTNQDAAKTAEFDFQNAFLQAATMRSVQVQIGSAESKKIVTLRRWSLTQQMQLGHSMAIVLNSVATNLAKHINLDKDGQVTVSFEELINNTIVFSKTMAECSEHLFRVVSATLAPNFPTLEAAQEYAETLDLADAIQVVLLIVKHNAMTEETKKKFVDLAGALPKPQPSQSPSPLPV